MSSPNAEPTAFPVGEPTRAALTNRQKTLPSARFQVCSLER